MSGWVHSKVGWYTRVEDDFEMFVQQVGELWINAVYHKGQLIDKGEWDSRSAAFRNCKRGWKNAIALRSPVTWAEKEELEDDSD